MKISKSNLLVFITSFLSIYLIYLKSLGNVNFSVALLLFSLIGIWVGLSHLKRLFKNKVILIYTMYTISLLIPILYSTNYDEGIAWFIKNIFSILMMIFGMYLYIKDTNNNFLEYLVYLGIPLAAMNILFFFSPSIEARFYETDISTLIVSPSSFYDIMIGNFSDPFKSGGIFINTNNASVYFILFLTISFSIWYKSKSTKFLALTLLYFVAQLCTGCRTGFLSLLAIVIYFYLRTNKENSLNTFLGSISLFGAIIIIYNFDTSFFDYILSRLTMERLLSDPRFEIWDLALTNFKLFGWGFGGWNTFSSTLSNGLTGMPQHNHLIILGYNGGILVIITYLLFWYENWKNGKKAWVLNNHNGIVLMFLIINIIVHGMFDNYFLGQMNILVLLFILIGYLTMECKETCYLKSISKRK